MEPVSWEGIHDLYVSDIRYLPPKKKMRLDGKEEELPKAWRGLVHPPNLDHAVVVELESKWVNDNLSEGFQKILKELRDEDNLGYVLIPEGDSSHHQDSNDTGEKDSPKTHGFVR